MPGEVSRSYEGPSDEKVPIPAWALAPIGSNNNGGNTVYTPRSEDLARLKNDHTYHPPIPELGQGQRYEQIRAAVHDLGVRLLTLCPPSRELSVALTKLDEAVFWANASIARNEKA